MAICVNDYISSWTETIQQHTRDRRVCLVIDPGVENAYNIHQQVENLRTARRVDSFTHFTANPTWTSSTEGFAVAQSIDAECIVAVGGGTALDLAKIIATAMEVGDLDSLWDQHQKGTLQQVSRTEHTLIAVPTTAGTGAETTPFAVIYREGIKHSIAGPALQPDHSALDPTLLEKLPPPVLIDAGLDAACQAMESIWSRRSNPQSETHAWAALDLIVHHFPQVVKAPEREHLAAMLVGAHLAGRAISTTTTTAPHALSYGLTSKLDIPHGRAVALLFGGVYDATLHAPSTAFSDTATQTDVNQRLAKIAQTWGQSPTEFTLWWDSFLAETMGISFPTQALDTQLIDQLLKGVNAKRLSNHPCQFDASQIRDLYANLAI